MLNFLFWNVAKKPLGHLIAAAATSVQADCVLLCECSLTPSEVIDQLNQGAPDYRYARGNIESPHLMFFTKFNSEFLVPMFESARISIRRLSLPARKDILIAAAHLPSRLFFGAESLSDECRAFAAAIDQEEQQVGHKRTIVVGDLNVNPFESGVIGAGGLHAVSSREVARRESRTIQERTHHFFYNPMWNCFGDRATVPGTYYYERAESVNYFWNVYDQVLVRPALLEGFDPKSLRVLTSAGGSELLDASGRPNSSDHLPVSFGINF